MDFLYMKPITILLEDVLPGYKPEKRNSSPEVTFQKLLVIQDRLTDFTFLIPCTIYIKTQDMIEMWEQKVVPVIGLPQVIVSDQDPLFMSKEFQK